MNGIMLFGDATGQAGIADALNTGLSADAFWNALSPFIPLVITVSLVSLGYMFIKKLTRRFSRGKGGAA